MRRFRKWVLTLGIIGVTPSLVLAGPLSFLDFGAKKPAATKQAAKSENQEVAEQIAAALREAKLSGYDIQIQYRDGTATLTGSIPDLEQKKQASRVVAKVRRVSRVENQLAVGNAEPITQTSQSVPAKEKKEAAPQPLQGIRKFANILQKKLTPKSASPAAPAAKSEEVSKAQPASASERSVSGNQHIAEQLAAALRTANLTSSGIDIEVRGGTTVLTGTIGNEAQKQTVTQLASNIDGVLSVDNQLKLLEQQPRELSASPQMATPSETAQSDEAAQPASFASESPETSESPKVDAQAVAEQIALAMHQTSLRGNDITVRYQNGNALLTGSVASPNQVQQAAEIALSVPGVQSVDTQLAVLGGPQGVSPALMAPTRPGVPVAVPVLPAGLNQPVIDASQGQPGGPPIQVTMATQGAPSVPPAPPAYGHPGSGASHAVYNMPHLPPAAWPSYASYPNYAQVTYPKEYSASAWPYIGPFYPYPQIPLGWRKTQLEWDDGYWSLNFRPRTGRWWWFLNPENW